MNPEELYEKVFALHREGYGSRRIAKLLDVSRKKFEHWLYQGFKPRPEPDLTPSSELAYVVGAVLGDGTVSKGCRSYNIRLAVKDQDFVCEFRKCLLKVAKRKVSLFFRGKENLWIATTSCKHLYLYFKRGNFEDVSKNFPADFICGFADAEGSATIDERYGYIRISLANTNLSILENIREILKNQFTIDSKIYRGKKYGRAKKTCYCLQILNQIDVAKFSKSIGFKIQRKAEKLSKSLLVASEMMKRAEVYDEVWKLHREGFGYRRISRVLGISRNTIEGWIARGHKPWGYDNLKKVGKKIKPPVVKRVRAI